ncbi:hypothetical protein ScPMuIL_008166 [Solemya velum]
MKGSIFIPMILFITSAAGSVGYGNIKYDTECQQVQDRNCSQPRNPNTTTTQLSHPRPPPYNHQEANNTKTITQTLEPHVNTSQTLEPHINSSQTLEPHINSSQTLEPHINTSQTLEPHINSSQTLAPHINSSQTLAPHINSSQTLEPHINSSQTLEPHINSSQTLEPHINSSQTLEPHINTSQTLEPHINSSQTLAPHINSSQTLAPHINSSQTLEPHINSSQTLEPHINSSQTLEPHINSSQTLEPHINSSQTLEPHINSSQTLEPHVNSSQTLEPHINSSQTLEPHINTSQTLEPHINTSQTLEPHINTSQTLEPHINTSQTLEPHINTSQTLEPHINTSQTLEPHINTSQTLEPHINTSQTLEPHINTSQTLAPHINTSQTLAPHINTSQTLEPHINTSQTLEPHINTSQTLEPHINTSQTLEPHCWMMRYDGDPPFVCTIKQKKGYDKLAEMVNLKNMMSKNRSIGMGILQTVDVYTIKYKDDLDNLDNLALNVSFIIPFESTMGIQHRSVVMVFRSVAEEKHADPVYLKEGERIRVFDFKTYLPDDHNKERLHPRKLHYECLVGLSLDDFKVYEVEFFMLPSGAKILYYIATYNQLKKKDWKSTVAVAALPEKHKIHVVFEPAPAYFEVDYYKLQLLNSYGEEVDSTKINHNKGLFSCEFRVPMTGGNFSVMVLPHGLNCGERCAMSQSYRVEFQVTVPIDSMKIWSAVLGSLAALLIILILALCFFIKYKNRDAAKLETSGVNERVSMTPSSNRPLQTKTDHQSGDWIELETLRSKPEELPFLGPEDDKYDIQETMAPIQHDRVVFIPPSPTSSFNPDEEFCGGFCVNCNCPDVNMPNGNHFIGGPSNLQTYYEEPNQYHHHHLPNHQSQNGLQDTNQLHYSTSFHRSSDPQNDQLQNGLQKCHEPDHCQNHQAEIPETSHCPNNNYLHFGQVASKNPHCHHPSHKSQTQSYSDGVELYEKYEDKLKNEVFGEGRDV